MSWLYFKTKGLHRAVKEPINRLSLPWWLLVTIDRLIDSCPNIILWNCWEAVGSRGSDVVFWHETRMKKFFFFFFNLSFSRWQLMEDCDLNRLSVFFHVDSKVVLQKIKQLISPSQEVHILFEANRVKLKIKTHFKLGTKYVFVLFKSKLVQQLWCFSCKTASFTSALPHLL